MSDLCKLIWCALIGPFRPRAALQAEILVVRHQLNVLRRKSPKRLAFGNVDRLVFTALYRMAPGVLDALKILKPQTVIRWHRAGFRAYWGWKSRGRGRHAMERAARRPELVERPIIYGICHLRRREGAGGMSRPVALSRPAGRGARMIPFTRTVDAATD
jgi:hypothetical protein